MVRSAVEHDPDPKFQPRAPPGGPQGTPGDSRARGIGISQTLTLRPGRAGPVRLGWDGPGWDGRPGRAGLGRAGRPCRRETRPAHPPPLGATVCCNMCHGGDAGDAARRLRDGAGDAARQCLRDDQRRNRDHAHSGAVATTAPRGVPGPLSLPCESPSRLRLRLRDKKRVCLPAIWMFIQSQIAQGALHQRAPALR